jgi:hypothetical protein
MINKTLLLGIIIIVAVLGSVLAYSSMNPGGEFKAPVRTPEPIQKMQEFTGYLETIIVDDFENELTDTLYYLHTETGKYELKSEKNILGPYEYEMTVKGTLSEGNINVEELIPLIDTSFKTLSETNIKEENLGSQNTLIVILNINDSVQRFDKEEMESFFFSGDYPSFYDYYDKNSYGKISFDGVVMGPYNVEWEAIHDSRAKAIELVDDEIYFPDYSRMVLLISNDYAGNSDGGWGTIGKTTISTDDGLSRISTSWIYENSFRIMVHEMGHNLGLWHANTYECFDEDTNIVQYSSLCLSHEYGDPYDIMGFPPSGHFSVAHKHEAGWLTNDNTITVTEGTYSIKPLQMGVSPGEIQQIRLPVAFEDNYYDS